MTNTDFILLLIAIVLILKDCSGASYKDELKGIKNELSNIRNEIRQKGGRRYGE